MDDEGNRFRMKPMNCPHHFMIYRSRSRSYRDLPLRYAELGTCYRYERAGALHGMLRVRGFTQDDAHIFVREDQISGEYHRMLDLVAYLLDVFGYQFEVALSTRPEKAIGDAAVYDAAVDTLAAMLEERGQAYEVDEGGGAFYGPKVDILLVDALGRKWQGPTFQLDFLMPERFGLDYVGSDNQRHNVVVIHRTMLGSMERFIGGLVEHYAGAFPVWLAPEQVRVLPVSEVWSESARELVGLLRANGVRAQLARPGHARLPHPRGGGEEGALHGSGGEARSRGGDGGGAHARCGQEAGGHGAGRVRRAGRRRHPHAGALVATRSHRSPNHVAGRGSTSRYGLIFVLPDPCTHPGRALDPT